MVILAESFLQYHEENAFKIAMTLNPPIDLKSYLRYVDDSHARISNIQETVSNYLKQTPCNTIHNRK